MTKKLLITPYKSQAGFTLIELLIVIVIIVILIGIGAASYTTVARNSRDSQRKSDLQKIASALEEFYADYREYPPDTPVGELSDCLTGADCALPTGTRNTNEFISALPTDPQSGNPYVYNAESNNQKYELSATFEGTAPAGFDPLRSPNN